VFPTATTVFENNQQINK